MKFFFAFLFAIPVSAKTTPPNELVQFLAGNWDNISFEVAPGKPVIKEQYQETMVVKDPDTLTITAHAFKDGKDLTKDMHLEVRGNKVTMVQGDYKATGTKEDKVYSLKGKADGKEFRFRLYTLDDRYVFQRETWQKGKIQQVDMSYLVRK